MTGDKGTSPTLTAAIRRVLSGDVESYEVIHNHIDRPLRAFIHKHYWRYGPDSEREILTWTLVVIQERLHRFDPRRSKLFTWSCWQCRTAARAVKRERDDPRLVSFDETKHEPWTPTAAGPSDLLEVERQDRELRLAFDVLPDDCKRAIYLYDIKGYTFAKTAEQMGVTVWNVREARNRGLAVLKRRLQERGVRPLPADSTPVPVWHGWDTTGRDDDFTYSVTADRPVSPRSLVGAKAKDDNKEEPEN